MSAVVRQASGWWPALVQVVCEDCGFRGPVVDLNRSSSAHVQVRLEAEAHVCGEG